MDYQNISTLLTYKYDVSIAATQGESKVIAILVKTVLPKMAVMILTKAVTVQPSVMILEKPQK